MGSPTQGMWVCRHNVDGRDWCPECFPGPEGTSGMGVIDELMAEVRAEVNEDGADARYLLQTLRQKFQRAYDAGRQHEPRG